MKNVVVLMVAATPKCHVLFRDGKSTDEEIKAWQFWHQRQHSVSFSPPLLSHAHARFDARITPLGARPAAACSDKFIHK